MASGWPRPRRSAVPVTPGTPSHPPCPVAEATSADPARPRRTTRAASARFVELGRRRWRRQAERFERGVELADVMCGVMREGGEERVAGELPPGDVDDAIVLAAACAL